jgi:TBC1 domain-containing protein 4
MVWYRQLCAEVDGVISQDRVQLLILKYIHSLCEEDRASILQKFHGAEGQSILEQNQLLMMLLRVHCEAKQVKHIHDTTENR